MPKVALDVPEQFAHAHTKALANMSMTRKQGSFFAFSKSDKYVVSIPAFSDSRI
jgi:hypothetical protein